MTTPAQMALEYRIWHFANPLGWNVTPGEIATELGVHHNAVKVALTRKGWSHRVRGVHQVGAMSTWNGGVASSARHIDDDVAHGRINMSVD